MPVEYDRIKRRVAGMSEGELLDWLYVALSGMMRHLDKYRDGRNPDHLGELMMAETQAAIVLQELMTRRFPAESVPSADSASPVQPVTTSAPRRSMRRRVLRGLSGPATAVG